ncbi:class II glutamine amidotransferase [Microbacterium lacus]
MSRMLAFVAAQPAATADAIGDRLLTEFAALAKVHSDGWGTAWLDPESGAVTCVSGAGTEVGSRRWFEALAGPASARMVYLRFASRGSPASSENSQPFHRDGVAFQHNGLLAPRDRLVDLLHPLERTRLLGTTDSEAYFAVVRDRVGAVRSGRTEWAASSLAVGVAEVRARFPVACLNAMLLSESGLRVVHSTGTAPAPLAAFVDRGADLSSLPSGHGEDYNTLLSTTTDGGVRIVATTGVDQIGWMRLPGDTVFEVAHDEIRGVALDV